MVNYFNGRVQIRRSATPSVVPVDLLVGELEVNLPDRKLYVGATDGTSTLLVTGPLVSVKDFFAVGDGLADDTAALQNAANSLTDIYFPPGTYLISTPIKARSGSTFWCHDGQATIKAAPGLATYTVGNVPTDYCFITNVNNAVTTLTDSDITFDGLVFNATAFAAPRGGFHVIRMSYVNRVRVLNCRFMGNASAPFGDATAMIGCADSLVDGCYVENCNNCAYDHWAGTTDAKVVSSVARGCLGYGILYNAQDTADTANFTADGLLAEGNSIYGWGVGYAAVFISPLGAPSRTDIVRNCRIIGNLFDTSVLSTAAGGGVIAVGASGHHVISDNIFVGNPAAPAGNNAITIGLANSLASLASVVSNNVIIDWSTTVGNVALIQIQGTNTLVSHNVARGGTYPALVWLGNSGNVGIANIGIGGSSARYSAGLFDMVLDANTDTSQWEFYNPVSAKAGITFPGTGTPSVLSRYERGNWTPLPTFAGASHLLIAATSGQYTLIGNVIFWNCSIVFSSKGDSVGQLQINGMPFFPVIGPDSGTVTDTANMVGLLGTPVVYRAGASFIARNGSVDESAAYLTNANFANNSVLRLQGWFFVS